MPARRKVPPPAVPKVRVVIVGGGCAGIAAAWQLAKLPNYQIAVYEQSWRLGGKGASGRDSNGLIREHGLHIWMGFYENAFRMMRECYDVVEGNKWGPGAALGQRLPHGSMAEAFVAEPRIGVAVPHAAGGDKVGIGPDWAIWSAFLPPAEGLPGEPFDKQSNPFTLASYLRRCFDLVKALLQSVVTAPDGPGSATLRDTDLATVERLSARAAAAVDPRPEAIDWFASLLKTGGLTVAAVALQLVHILETLVEKHASAAIVAPKTMRLVLAVIRQLRKLLADIVSIDHELRHRTAMIDVVVTIAFGLFRDRVLFGDKGFDAVNGEDYRAWLKRHGATEAALGSSFITGIYDLVFAYENGDRGKPRLAAGVALRGALRMFFTYRGSLFWRMQSGMGDTVFAPLYKALQQVTDEMGEPRVTFHFLQRLDEISFKPRATPQYVENLWFGCDADRDALDNASMSALDHFGCWPDSRRLFPPAQTRKSGGTASHRFKLTAGADFDVAIVAASKDDFCAVGGRSGLFDDPDSQWNAMRRHVKTVATQAAQAWLSTSLEDLGWNRANAGIGTAFAPPFGTWADMTHTLTTEAAWRRARDADESAAAEVEQLPQTAEPPFGGTKSATKAGSKMFPAYLRNSESLAASRSEPQAAADVAGPEPRAVVYVCGELAETDRLIHADLEAFVRDNLLKLLHGGTGPLWPAQRDRAIELLHYHVQANYRDPERYTLSLPGSLEHRISPLDDLVANLVIAGDWTAAGMDAGCVETAVMSGMLAAHAISGRPLLETITGYDHP